MASFYRKRSSILPFGSFVLSLSLTACSVSSSQISTTDSNWGKPEMIVSSEGDSLHGVKIVMDSKGSLIVAWAHSGHGVEARRFEPGRGWDKTELITKNIGTPPALAVNPSNGDVLIAWNDEKGQTWTRWYILGNGWNEPKMISEATSAVGPIGQAGIDSKGNAVVAWFCYEDQSRHSGLHLCANGYSAANHEWEKVKTLKVPDNIRGREMVMDPQGKMTIIWNGGDGLAMLGPSDNPSPAYVSQFSPETGWSSPKAISATNAGSSNIGIDDLGVMTAVWVYPSYGNNTLYTCRYKPNEGWGSPENITSSTGGQNSSPMIAAAGNHVLILWTQQGGAPRRDRTFATWFDLAGGWSKPENIDLQTGGSSVVVPKAVLDSSGNALAVWRQQGDATIGLYGNHYVARSGGWSGPSIISTSPGKQPGVGEFALVSDSNGHAWVAWDELKGGTNIDPRRGVWLGGAKKLWVREFVPKNINH